MKKYLSSLIFLLAFMQLNAQTQKDSKSTTKELPALEKVLAYADANSHLVKEEEALSQHYGQTVKVTEKLWMDKIFLDLGVQRSNNGAILNVNNNVSTQEFNSLSYQNMNSFRAGLIVRVSLYDIMARKDLVKQAQFRQMASEQHSKYLRQEVKFRIVDLYKDAQLAYKLLGIKSEKKYALFMQKEMAEKEFQQGQLHISEFGRITELTSNAYAEFEQASTNYEKLYFQLELVLGMSLKDLK